MEQKKEKKSKKKKKLTVIDIIFYVGAIIAIVFFGFPKIKQFVYNRQFVASTQSNTLLNGLILKDVNGTEYSLDDMRGKVIILDFWASWCGPCKRKIPGINKLYQKYGRDAVVILGINVGEDDAKIRNAIQQLKIIYPVIPDTEGVLSRKFNISSLPTLIFIDKSGDIVKRGGFPFGFLDSTIKGLLKK